MKKEKEKKNGGMWSAVGEREEAGKKNKKHGFWLAGCWAASLSGLKILVN